MMYWRIVGILADRPYDMTDERSGKRYTGLSSKLYIESAFENDTIQNLINGGKFSGYECMSISVPKKQNVKDFQIGDVIQFFYNQYRKVDMILKINPEDIIHD